MKDLINLITVNKPRAIVVGIIIITGIFILIDMYSNPVTFVL